MKRKMVVAVVPIFNHSHTKKVVGKTVFVEVDSGYIETVDVSSDFNVRKGDLVTDDFLN